MMEAARSLGLAARFVSGYIFIPGADDTAVAGGGATHAWMQVYLPGAGWIDFDPTNSIIGNRNLIRVAVAWDHTHVLPLWGTFVGKASSFLGMDVSVSVTEETPEDEQGRETGVAKEYLMQHTSKVRKIAFVGDHLPRKCGIATFTTDLLAAVQTAHPQSDCFAVSVNDIKGGYEYPEVVHFEIEEQDLSSYIRAADFLNISNVDMVCLQHEFGIFGGPAGGHILAFLRELRMPVVTTLHTVLREPRADQRRVMQELISLSTRLVVMTERGKQMLQEVYHAPTAKIDLIAHGIPDVGFVDPTYFKDQFGVEGKVVLLTFGLLSPNKGIEYVLNALPEIVAEFPEVVYIVLGATHPNELREHGEAYRVSLEMLAKKNKVEKNVIFYNDFVELENLKEFIGAADLYITPYLNEAQITSGTLAYTFGAGKAVVSTPYWHAAELLAEDRGVLVPFADAAAIAREVIGLLRDDTRRHAMRKNAYRMGREMIWSNVAQLYMRSFELSRLQGAALSRKSLVTKTLDQRPRELPELKLDHLSRMTDSTGVFQHAIFGVPNFSEGYCTDDNARAFILAVLLDELGEEPDRLRAMSTTCAAFLHHAFDAQTKRFHNHMSFDRRLARRAGIGRLPGPRVVGPGRRRGAFAVPQLPDDGRTAVRAGTARVDRVHLAPSLGLRLDRYP